MKLYDYKNKGLEYIISYFRTNKDIVNILQTIGQRYEELQNILQQLLTNLNISKARGKRLDYIGAEVGASRDESDFGEYFCINRLHLNVPKPFYFITSGLDPKSTLSLSDAEYIQKIYAYIGTNSSSGSLEELISIIKKITNADTVLINKNENQGISIDIKGDGLIMTKNTINYIQNILGDGIYLEEIKTND